MIKTVLMSTVAATFALGAPALAQQQSPGQTPQASQSQGSQPHASKAGSMSPGAATSADKTTAQNTNNPSKSTMQKALRTVDPATLRMTFYAVQANDLQASDLMGMNVYNLNNENVGEIADLVLDNGKRLNALVVDVGGFLGIGERRVALAPGSLLIVEQSDGSARALVHTTKDTLKNAPVFEFDQAKADAKAKSASAGNPDAAGTTTGSGASSPNGKPAANK